jgi:hypothetical protein
MGLMAIRFGPKYPAIRQRSHGVAAIRLWDGLSCHPWLLRFVLRTDPAVKRKKEIDDHLQAS